MRYSHRLSCFVLSMCLLGTVCPGCYAFSGGNQPDFTLKGLAAWLRQVSQQVHKQDRDKSAELDQGKLMSLYEILNKLQNTRGQYLQALQSLVEARDAHMDKQTLMIRSREVAARAAEVDQQLNSLDAALYPLQLNLDLRHPNVGAPVKHYQQRQEMQMKQTKQVEMVGSFTVKELKKIQKDAETNGETLQKSIDVLRTELQNKYVGGA